MNVFELIKEKLEKYIAETYNEFVEGSRDAGVRCNAYHNAKEIVDEVAQEYNNGWIPCSERLPEEIDHLADGKKKNQYLVKTKYEKYEVAEWLEIYGQPLWMSHYAVEIRDVIAWQPLPAPYKEGGMQ